MTGFLASLVNGDDSCGPLNPVAQLTKGLHGGADSVSRDRFVPIAGPSSSQGFRSHNLQPHEVEQDAAARAFFQQHHHHQPGHHQQSHVSHPTPFNLDPLRQALPPSGVPAWAADFQASARQQSGSPAGAAGNISERAWEKSRIVDTHHHHQHHQHSVPAWASDFAASHHSQQHDTPPQALTPMSATTPMRMASPGPSMASSQAPVQFQPMMAAHSPFMMMGQQPSLDMNAGQMSQFMPIYNLADNQISHRPPPLFDQGERLSEIVDDTKVAQDSSWETAFLQHLQKSPKLAAAVAEDLAQEASHEALTYRATSPSQIQNPDDPDLLSRTARELLDNIQHDLSRNDKMNNSSFMSLMRKLRDKQVKVEGNDMVESTQTGASVSSQDPVSSSLQPQLASDGSILQPSCILAPSATPGMQESLQPSTAQKGDTAADLNDLTAAYEEMNAVMDDDADQRQRRQQMGAFVGDASAHWDDGVHEQDFLHHDHPQGRAYSSKAAAEALAEGARTAWEEDLADFELDDALLKSGPLPPSEEQMNSVNPQQAEWANLQSQWEEFEATSSGVRQAPSSSSQTADYPFHQRNPYLQFSVTNNNHQMHDYHTSSRNLPANTLLEREADVQLSPHDPVAWLNLGLKQQEAERESLAIAALQRALELDASLKEAWLALAVSFTNDNIRGKAYDAIEKWVDCKTEYAEVAKQYRALNSVGLVDGSTMTTTERHHFLTGLLVEMARAGTGVEHGVDADVQIALGVMFNASEDYDKACDCFFSALSVRPNDPHLFNRLGATLANSGKAEEAIEYYYKALELQPDFARATVNLAIACINLNAYQEAAEHLLRALALQQASDADIGDLTPSLSHTTEAEFVESSTLLWETLATCCNSLGRSDLAQACAKRNLAPFKEGVFAA